MSEERRDPDGRSGSQIHLGWFGDAAVAEADIDVGPEENGVGDASVDGERWYDVLSDDQISQTGIDRYDDLASFAHSHSELRKKLSGAAQIPGESATSAERHAYYVKTGKPDAAAGYELSSAKVSGKDGNEIEINKDLTEKLRTVFYDANLTKGQAAMVNNAINGHAADNIYANNVSQQQDHDAKMLELQKLWRGKFDENMTAMKRAVRTFGSERLLTKLDKIGMGNDTDMIEAFYNVGTALLEGRFIPGEGEGRSADDPGVSLGRRYGSMKGIAVDIPTD